MTSNAIYGSNQSIYPKIRRTKCAMELPSGRRTNIDRRKLIVWPRNKLTTGLSKNGKNYKFRDIIWRNTQHSAKSTEFPGSNYGSENDKMSVQLMPEMYLPTSKRPSWPISSTHVGLHYGSLQPIPAVPELDL